MVTDYSWISELFQNGLLPAFGWGLLAFFLPALIAISIKLKRSRGSDRIQFIKVQYGLANDRYYQLHTAYQSSGLNRNAFVKTRIYWFPIVVVTLICIVFATIMIFTTVFVNGPNTCNMFFEVSKYMSDLSVVSCGKAYPTIVAISYAFLGWYAWSVSSVFSRLVTMEFVPGTLYALLSRLVLSIIVAAVLYNIGIDLAGTGLPSDSAEARNLPETIGFMTGLFPMRSLSYIVQRLARMWGPQQAAPEKPLELIQGISAWRMFRLYDAGLDDCENLAAVNPIELYESTNLPLLEISDWVAQAQLAVLLNVELFQNLQKNGVRTSLDFERIAGDPAFVTVLMDLTQYKADHIEALRSGMITDPNFSRLRDLRQRILASDEAEAKETG